MPDTPLQDWVEAYKELCDRIKVGVPEIRHIDLWMEQTSNESDEYPFASPAVFLQFDADSIDEVGDNEQLLHMRVTAFLHLDTLADTFKDSLNQESALRFGELMRKLHVTLHGKTGTHHGPLTRVSLRKEAAPPYVQLYSQTYATELMDTSTAPAYDQVQLSADQQRLVPGTPPGPVGPPLYTLP